jgi:hypothetical protein
MRETKESKQKVFEIVLVDLLIRWLIAFASAHASSLSTDSERGGGGEEEKEESEIRLLMAIGLLHEGQGRLDQSESFYRCCLEKRREIQQRQPLFHKRKQLTCAHMLQLAGFYETKMSDQFEKAEELLTARHELIKSNKYVDDQETLSSL